MNLSYHIGTVTAVAASRCEVRARVSELGLDSWWLQVLVPFAGANKMYFLPSVGDRVALLLDGDGSRGLVLGGVYDAKNPPNASGLNLLAIAIAQTTISGNLTVTGNVAVQGSHSINGKATVVVGSIDSGGDTNNQSGQ